LAIIDLHASADQPMHAHGLTCVFNGEIYNYLEIKAELEALGYAFQTASDTEVLMAAYRHWGADCLARFNGMWAFAIYDANAQTLFCARDRFGVKPFYQVEMADGGWAFASEIPALLALLPTKPPVNQSILADYLVLGLEEHTDDTFYEGITKLPAGHHLTINLRNGAHSLARWYAPKPANGISSLSTIERERLFEETLQASIALRLRADVQVGTCLSGGLDSSAITALAAPLYSAKAGAPFLAVTAGFSDPNNDETTLAALVATHTHARHVVTRPTEADFRAALDEVIRAQAEPFGSPSVYMQHFVFKAARAQGCPVMLDGQGGDETLLGYERYLPTYLRGLAWWKIPGAWRALSRRTRLNWRQVMAYHVYFTNPGVRMTHQKRRWDFLKPELLEQVSGQGFATLEALASAQGNPLRLQTLELTQTQLPHLLRYEDRSSMTHAIESRLPFLDYRLVELSLALPLEDKIQNGWTKSVLRKVAARHLPQSIAYRTNKFGFEAPVRHWLGREESFRELLGESPFVQSLLADSKGQVPAGLDTTAKWRLVNLARWAG
jgi:asparagine synthase (glutamine-hydrolysing)